MKPQPWKWQNHCCHVGACLQVTKVTNLQWAGWAGPAVTELVQHTEPEAISYTQDRLHLLGVSGVWNPNSTMHRGIRPGSLHCTYWSMWSLPFLKILETMKNECASQASSTRCNRADMVCSRSPAPQIKYFCKVINILSQTTSDLLA